MDDSNLGIGDCADSPFRGRKVSARTDRRREETHMANIAVWSQRVAGGRSARAKAGIRLNWRRLLALGLNVLAWVAIVELLIHVFRGH